MDGEPYRERPAALPGATVWTRTPPADGEQLVLPDGCMDLIYMNGTLLVAGPDARPQQARLRAGVPVVALRFAPGQAPGVLGVPAHELRDTRVELAALWSDAAARRAADLVAARGVAGLESLALQRFPGADPVVAALAGAAARGTRMREVAARSGYSERQLHRRSVAAFGYGAKTLARILRMQRALALGRAGWPLAAVAATAGYADQAHLSREVRALTDAPPTAALAPAG